MKLTTINIRKGKPRNKNSKDNTRPSIFAYIYTYKMIQDSCRINIIVRSSFANTIANKKILFGKIFFKHNHK